MISWLEKFNKPKTYLLLVNVFLVFFLIILNNLKVIPLQLGDFVFFTILALAFALWRPSWAFLFFCGTVPLENVNLAPLSLGIAIRPYQFIGAILVVAVLARLASGRLNFKLAKLKIPDYAVILMAMGGLLGAIFSPDKMTSLKLEIIFITFVMLYFLVRNYIQNIDDAKKTVPFFLSSALVVMLYGLWQNIIYLHSRQSFEVMLGRPNATFTEADWLGAFMVLIVAIFYALLYYPHSEWSDRMTELGIYFFLALSYILLILTVSRSAWLAALVAWLIFIWIFFTDLRFKNWRLKETVYLKIKIFVVLVLSIAIVYIFHLTNFQLLNRVQSTGTGLQKITVSCDKDDNLPKSIKEIAELEKYNCHHINLEDIDREKEAGRFVTEVNRPDPNMNVRAQIYQKSWVEIKNHPLTGIGWGSIGPLLGRDGRGTALNSSNIFLETYLGAGILGFLALIFLLSHILFTSVKNYFYATNRLSKTFNLFIIISWFGLVIFNLFNAGIFLGFLWVWLAIVQMKDEII